MANDLPYLPTYKNVGTLFEKIEKAKIPDTFNLKFLTETIGLRGSGDRQLISLLKKLGFLDNTGKPTPEYNRLKNKNVAGRAVADAVRTAYAPLYAADENAHELSNDVLKGLIAQVSGTEESLNKLIMGTFRALEKVADFADSKSEAEDKGGSTRGSSGGEPERDEAPKPPDDRTKFNPEFRFNIEIHLPSNGTEETYLAIFNALRRALA